MLNKHYIGSININRLYLIPVIAMLCIGGVMLADGEDSSDQATGTWTSGDCTVTFDDTTGAVAVTGNGAMQDYDPNAVPPWVSDKLSFTSLSIGNGVTHVGSHAFQGCNAIASLTIGTNVATIGDFAFSACPIKSVTLPSSLTTIGESAFLATGLTSVTIPDSVTTIGSYAFSGCHNLASVTLPSTLTAIEDRVFDGCRSLTFVTIPDSVTSIGQYAFFNCISLTKIKFTTAEWNITTIGTKAFELGTSDDPVTATVMSPNDVAYEHLDPYVGQYTTPVYSDYKEWVSGACTVTMDDNGIVTVTGNGAMANYATASARPWHQNAQDIVAVVFEDGVTGIGNYAFAECYSLKSVTMTSVQTVGQYAFKGCSTLTAVNYNEGVQSIGHYSCQDCIALKSITIPASVTNIYAGAFQGCVLVEDVRFETDTWNVTVASASFSLGTATVPATAVVSSPNNVANGKLDSYKGNYTTLTYAPSVMSWTSGDTTCVLDMTTGVFTISGTGAMADYSSGSSVPWYTYRSNINSVVVEDGVTSIGSRALYFCRLLTNVTVGNSVLSIGESAFYGCESLTSVTIPGSVETIGDNAFRECKALNTFTIPNSVTSIGGSAFYDCTTLESVVIGNSVQTIGASAFYNCKALTSVAIPDSVTSLGNYIFYGCLALTSVDIGNGVTSVPNSSFNGCYALTNVTFGNSVQSIGPGAFYSCAITSVTLPDSVTSISSNAFYHCTQMESLQLGQGLVSIGPDAFRDCSALTTLEIPALVTTIGNQAFQNCTSLTYVDIGASVESIGQRAFENCPVVAIIIFQTDEWNVTSIGEQAFGLGTADHPTTAIVYSRDNVAQYQLNGYINDNTVIYYHDLPKYAVTITVNNAEWGSVDLAYVLVERGTEISIEDNVLHVGTFSITATPNEPTAQYTFRFSGWTGIPLDGRVVQDLTITANFSAEVNQYTVTITVNDATYGSVDISSVTVDYGTAITQDANVLHIGDNVVTATASPQVVGTRYAFSDWNGLADSVTGDMTVTAVFDAISTAVVTYHGNGGQPDSQSETVDIGQLAHLSDYTCTREGYGFLGWSTSPTAITPISEFTVQADSDLYAVWSVSIDVAEYYGDTEHHITEVVEDETVTTMLIRLIPIFVALQLISSMQILFARRNGMIE